VIIATGLRYWRNTSRHWRVIFSLRSTGC
jgi:hypothetical protein